MTIVSLSFPDETLKEMNQMQESEGFRGRSELVRAALRLMIQDTKSKDSLKGRISAVIVVTHDEKDENPITALKHQFEGIVKTHVHSKIGAGSCVELFLVEGDGAKVASMTKAFQKEERMNAVKLVVI
jgi:CopG family transcriptional regulator, nickel-responsive regulator